MELKDALKVAYDALDGKNGEDIKVLDISELSVLSDYFVIATGKNTNHVKTLAQTVDEKLSKHGVFLKQKEGHNTATWILLDFGGIIVHIFAREEREFYDLEHIWGDAKIIEFAPTA